MRDNPRTTAVSAVAGVVLLAGLFGFAVLVPELGDDPASGDAASGEGEGSAASAGPIELPDRLGDSLVAIDLGTLPPELASQFGDLDQLKTREAAVGDGIDEVFDAPAAFRLYAAEDGTGLAQLTVVDKAPGYFAPEALAIDPATIGLARAASELVRAGDAVCQVTWPADVPAGQAIDPAVEPQRVRCQLGAGERTYEISTQGLTVDETTDLLGSVAST